MKKKTRKKTNKHSDMKFPHIFFLVFLLTLNSCDSTKSLIDNGADESRTIELDGKKFTLGPGKSEKIDLEAGVHKLTVKDVAGVAMLDTTFEAKGAGMVNAGLDGYVMWKLFYGLAKDRETALKEDWTEMDSVKYFGEFNYYPPNTPFVNLSWELGPDEPVEDAKNLVITQDFKVVRKLFRMDDFKKKYEEISKAK